ncbi:hypothetical protein FKW77_009151 [Venturia effusa]|uniref:Uncharacterized protein n=1 Tax=Venturia effusa TaxID=50376 RepID=A0A517L9W9_9PEZI|nr:hypothetical protein FKW77_009151 [Venturia effusa]
MKGLALYLLLLAVAAIAQNPPRRKNPLLGPTVHLPPMEGTVGAQGGAGGTFKWDPPPLPKQMNKPTTPQQGTIPGDSAGVVVIGGMGRRFVRRDRMQDEKNRSIPVFGIGQGGIEGLAISLFGKGNEWPRRSGWSMLTDMFDAGG